MGELLNLVGLSTGVVLYAMLLAMVVRGSRTPGVPSRLDSLLLATSVLGLVWNLCALPAYELPKVGIQGPFPALVALGFSALGFLPAVVVHSRRRADGRTTAPLRRSVRPGIDRHRGRAPHRRDPDYSRTVSTRAPRTGDREARDRGRAAGAPGPGQSAFLVQCADDPRLFDPDRAGSRAGD